MQEFAESVQAVVAEQMKFTNEIQRLLADQMQQFTENLQKSLADLWGNLVKANEQLRQDPYTRF